MLRLITVFIIVLISTTGWTQEELVPAGYKEKVRQMRIWKLTDKLNLSQEQSGLFFPVLNKHLDQLDEIRDKRQNELKLLRDKEKKATEKEVREHVQSMLLMEQQMLDSRRNFFKEAEKILTPEQLASLVIFDHDFYREFMQKMDRKPKNRPKGE